MEFNPKPFHQYTTSNPTTSINVNVVYYKIILLGDDGVGKTSILEKIINDNFTDKKSLTMKMDFKIKSLRIEDNKVDLMIWDSCGLEKFRNVTRSYYNNNDGCIIVFDVTRKSTFDNVKQWIEDVRNYGSEDQTIIIVGNKIDLKSQKEVSFKEINDLLVKFNLQYMEVSAKEGTQIEELFERISREIKKYKDAHPINSLDVRESISLDKSKHTQKAQNLTVEHNKKCCT